MVHAFVPPSSADARGMLGAGKKLPTNWGEKPTMSMRHVWMTDCRSLEGHLIAPTLGKTEDKRWSIDLNSLRQDIWTNGTEEVETVHPRTFCDKIRWVDT
eukprot:4330470-Pyramimonas_sp.AAC.1